MKIIKCFVAALLAACLFDLPAAAAGTSAQLSVELETKVFSLDLTYDVLAPALTDVADVVVTFDESLGNAEAGFDRGSGQLKIVIASGRPVEISEIGTVTAKLTSGGEVAPELQLVEMDAAYAEPVATSLSAERSGSGVSVTAKYRGGDGVSDRHLIFAGYDTNGRLIAMATRTEGFSAKTKTVTETLSGANIAKVKVFALDAEWKPTAKIAAAAVSG